MRKIVLWSVLTVATIPGWALVVGTGLHLYDLHLKWRLQGKHDVRHIGNTLRDAEPTVQPHQHPPKPEVK